MVRRSSLMSKLMVLMLAFAVVFTYSVLPLNQSFAASKKPAKVTGVKAKAVSSSSIKVSWKKAGNAKKYEVYKSTKKSSGFKKAGTTKGKSYTAKKLKAGTKYYFKVRAINGKKKGAFSKVAAAATKKKASEVVELPVTIGESKGRSMTTTIDMSDTKYDGKDIKVWVPLPMSDGFQNEFIDEEAVIAGITADDVKITNETEHGNRMLYIAWNKGTEASKRVAKFSYYAERSEVSRDKIVYDANAAIPDDAKPYITEESDYVKVNDPVVQAAAAEAVGNHSDMGEQARAIYEWVIANLERIDNGETLTNAKGETKTFEIDGCGYGDTVKILTDLNEFGRAGGHCTDINSTFVALCRAAGIPAREMFGIRLNDDATGGQHCWTEFYLPGTGWVYADPGDVLKAIKSGKGMTVEEVAAAKAGDTCKAKTEYFWGGVDNNRIVLSVGRDITFNPAQSWGKCNTFGYPAAEVDGKRLDTSFADAKNFKYTISCVNTITAYDLDASLNSGTYKILDSRKKADYDTGHIPGSVLADCGPAFDKDNPDEAAAKANVAEAVKGDPDSTKYAIICYSGNAYANKMYGYLQELGKKTDNLFILAQDDGVQGPNGGMKAWRANKYEEIPTVEAVAETKVYVSPQWLRSAIAGEQEGYEDVVVCYSAYPSNKYRDLSGMIANWENFNETYKAGHIPGAIHVAVADVEDPYGAEGAYNLLSADTIKETLLENGITSDTKVVLYSDSKGELGVQRVAYAYLWCGVKDVKVLDGNLPAWEAAGYKLETGENTPSAVKDFGVEVPAHPEYWTSTEQVRLKADSSQTTTYDENFKPVSIRAENEWLGIDSGYSYIDYAGEPKGAVWGKGADGAYDTNQFFHEDGTIKTLDEFKEVWKDCKFKVDDTQHLAFYCGTGWRACVPFLALYENGFKNISVFDGGWYEWLYHKDYPVQVGDPDSPDCVYTTVGELPSGKAAK